MRFSSVRAGREGTRYNNALTRQRRVELDSQQVEQEQVLLDPPTRTHVSKGDFLLVVTEDDMGLRGGSSPSADVARGSADASAVLPSAQSLLEQRVPALRSSSKQKLAAHTQRAHRERAGTPQVVLILGWRHDVVSLLCSFDRRLAEGSQVHILSQQPLELRERQMGELNMALNGACLDAEEARTSTIDRWGRGAGLVRTEVHHHVGSLSSPRDLRKLPLRDATSALVFTDADAQLDHLYEEGALSLRLLDSDAVKVTILLRQRRRAERVAASLESNELHDRPRPFVVVTQFVDVQTRRLLMRQPDILEPVLEPSGDAARDQLEAMAEAEVEALIFQRNKIESAALISAAHSSVGWASTGSLLDAGNPAELQVILISDLFCGEAPAGGSGDCISAEEAKRSCAALAEYSFHELYELLRWLELGTLIGWRRRRRSEVAGSADDSTEQMDPMRAEPPQDISMPSKAFPPPGQQVAN